MIGLLLLYPLWWALGLGVLIYPILAVPMALDLIRRRPVRLPPGFLLWALFLAVVVVSLTALEYDPPGTLPGSAVSRLPGAILRLVEYGSLTVLLLYAGNLRSDELPQRRLVGLLAWSFLITVVGGVVGTLWPYLSFTSPVELLLPDRYAENSFVRHLAHPSVAQLQEVLGYPTPRPAAPWGYTNLWGNNFFLLLPWFLVAGWGYARRRWQRIGMLVILAASVVPVVISLNRGLWLGLAAAAGYVALRLALRGRLAPLGGLVVAAAAVTVLLATTPLGQLVGERLANGHSNDIRLYTTERALDGIGYSPVIGFGSTRDTQGSGSTIAVGASAACDNCGNHTVGSNGQIWLELYAHGVLGAVLFLGFFGYVMWHYRRDVSPLGIAGSTVLVLNLLASGYYNTLVTPLAFTFLGLAVLWRRETDTPGLPPRRGAER
ncbi:MAG: O-antigen ligase family protein [Micromonosporaceae bacterium]